MPASWLAFSLGENSRLQVGGWGDIPPQEYLDGSPRIDAWLRARGSAHRGGWRPPGLEASWLPESEWGAEPDFGQSLAEFAAQAGFDYIPVSYRHPHHYSLLALGLVEAMYRHNNTQPAGSFVGMFNLYDPSTVFSRRLLPLWLVFNTTDSLHFLRALIDQLVDPIYLAALVTYSRPPDQAGWDQWAAAFEGRQWASVGARRSRYPQDTLALWSWTRWLEERHGPADPTPPRPLPVSHLNALVENVRLAAHWPVADP